MRRPSGSQDHYWDFGGSIILPPCPKHIPGSCLRPSCGASNSRQIGSGRGPGALGTLPCMQITPFRIEEYMGRHEFRAKYLLSSSDAQSQTIEELLALEPGAQAAFFKHWCGYTESPGAPWLREVLAKLYETINPEGLIVVSAAEEAIFLFYHALLTPSDHAILETPCYESALTVPKSTGAAVSEWRRKPDTGWAHDLAT